MNFENVVEKMSNEILTKLIRRQQKCFEIVAVVRSLMYTILSDCDFMTVYFTEKL